MSKPRRKAHSKKGKGGRALPPPQPAKAPTQLALPPGRRSCWQGHEPNRVAGEGGAWTEVALPGRFGVVAEDYQDVLSRLPDVARLSLLAEIDDLTNRAALGQLEFVSSGDSFPGAVKQMKAEPDVLEIVFGPREAKDGVEVQTRLYFTEPAAHARTLLLLRVAGKSPGRMWRLAQNSHIATAAQRLRQHQG